MQSVAGLDSSDLAVTVLLPIAYLVNRPHGMLCDQWLRICCRTLERWKVGWIAHISERDTHIP